MNRFDFCEKRKIPGQFDIKDDKNERIVIGQWELSENVTPQVYLTII